MKNLFLQISFLFLFMFLACNSKDHPQPKTAGNEEYQKSPELLVGELYKTISFNAGTLPDWEKIRSMFLDKSILALRTTPNTMTIFDANGFIDYFINFIQTTSAKQNGFTEKILKMKKYVVGDIAHILVLYDAQINGDKEPPQPGVDSWQLVKKDNRWWFASVTNEIISVNIPIPDELK